MKTSIDQRRGKTRRFTALGLTVSLVILIRGVQGWTESRGLSYLGLVADVLTGLVVVIALFRLRRTTRLTLAGALAILFLIVAMASAAVVSTTDPELALFGLRGLSLALVTVFAVQAATPARAEMLLISRALYAALLLNFLAAVSQAIFGYGAAELENLANAGSTYLVGDQVRLSGLQPSGQDFALMSGAAAAWGLSQLVRYGFRNMGRLPLVVLGLSLLTTLLSLQRGALVGVLASAATIGMIAIFSSRRVVTLGRIIGRVLMLFLTALTGALVASQLAPGQTGEALNRFFSLFAIGSDHSWRTRQSVTLPTTLGLIDSNPWGYGVGASGPVAASFGNRAPLHNYPLGGVAADNGFLFVALQLGVIGALLFAAMLLTWAINGRLIRNHANDHWGAIAVVAFTTGAMLTGAYWGLASTMTVVLALATLPAATRKMSAERSTALR